jgi:hypothetical protein
LSCPPALAPHLEFTVAAVLGVPVKLEWTPQPARPGTLYAALEWRAPAGTAGRLAARLRTLGPVSFDVDEAASPGCDAERYSCAPELGLHRAVIGANGDVLIAENQLHALLEETTSGPGLAGGLRKLLGAAWDDALEPLRSGGYGAPITHLRRTG